MNTNSIVLDLDGVISDIDKSISDVLLSRGVADYDYGPWLITDYKGDDAMTVFDDNLFWRNMKPYVDAWHQINKWFSEGIDIHIVTARRCEPAINQTMYWLDLWRINTLKPIFTNVYEKHDVIKDIDPLFVVEDNPHEVQILMENGIDCFLRKQWYNKEFWGNLKTIETLYDINLDEIGG